VVCLSVTVVSLENWQTAERLRRCMGCGCGLKEAFIRMGMRGKSIEQSMCGLMSNYFTSCYIIVFNT